MHVGHNVLADGNVSADGLGSPVVVSVDGASVDGDFVVEDLADVMVVTFGLDGGVVVNTGDVGPSSVHVDGVSVLLEHGGTDSHGVVVSASVVLLEADGKSVGLEESSTSGKPQFHVGVAAGSVLEGMSESVHSGVHLLVTANNNADGVAVSVGPDVDEARGVTVSVESSLDVSDGVDVSVESSTDDFDPGVVVVSSSHHHFVVVVSTVGGDSGSLVHGAHDVERSVVVLGPGVDLSAGVVHVSSGVEVSVDHVVSVLGESHVLGSESGLSFLVGHPGSVAGEESDVSGSLDGGLVVGDVDVDVRVSGNGGSEDSGKGEFHLGLFFIIIVIQTAGLFKP